MDSKIIWAIVIAGIIGMMIGEAINSYQETRLNRIVYDSQEYKIDIYEEYYESCMEREEGWIEMVEDWKELYRRYC